jgi:hypothetical protein
MDPTKEFQGTTVAGMGANQICGVTASDFARVAQRADDPVPMVSETRRVPEAATRIAATFAPVSARVAESAPEEFVRMVPSETTIDPLVEQLPARIARGYPV